MITPPRDGNKVNMSQDYAITLTLSPHLYDLITKEQAEKALKCFKFCTSNVSNIKVSAFMEETKTYNIHIHGIISVKMTDYVKRYGAHRFITNLFRNKNWGKVKDISPVTNYDSWTKYIIKDVFLEREYYPVIIDDYELLVTESKDSSDGENPVKE